MKEIIVDYLKINSKSFIRTMYLSLDIKQQGLSLNKFRLLLRSMEKEGILIEKDKSSYPYWELSNEKD